MPLRATTAASNSAAISTGGIHNGRRKRANSQFAARNAASVSAMESIGPAVQTVSSSAKALFMVVLPCTALRHLLHQPQGGQYTQQRTGNQGDNDLCPLAVELADNKKYTHLPRCNEQYQHRNQTPTGLCQLITDPATQHQGKGGHHHPQHPATDRQTRQHPQRLTQQEEHHQNQKTPQQHHAARSEEHTSELQSRPHLVCRLLLEKKKKNN